MKKLLLIVASLATAFLIIITIVYSDFDNVPKGSTNSDRVSTAPSIVASGTADGISVPDEFIDNEFIPDDTSYIPSGWIYYELPSWSLAHFYYPSNWSVTVLDQNNLSLGPDENEKIHVFYTALDVLTKGPSRREDYDKVMKSYTDKLSSTSTAVDPEITMYEGKEFTNSANGKNIHHNVFFIGTLFIDVSAEARDEMYYRILKTFRYGGY